MDYHFEKFFHEFSDESQTGNFHRVIALHEAPDVSWDCISQKVPELPRAWFELAQLNKLDRIEFLHDYWESRIQYPPNLSEFLDSFFQRLDDIGIYITQTKFDDPYVAQIVYSIRENGGFFRGLPPATEEEILRLQNDFSEFILPKDYLNFLQIHNGFYKTTDCTGITRSVDMRKSYEEFQTLFSSPEDIVTKNNVSIDPHKLIPFYKSFGTPYYHCFWAEWYPENEMGVVYYSSATKQVSNVSDSGTAIESLCFSTFSDWLIFYLEPIDT